MLAKVTTIKHFTLIKKDILEISMLRTILNALLVLTFISKDILVS